MKADIDLSHFAYNCPGKWEQNVHSFKISHLSGEFELGELFQAAGRRDLHEIDGLLHDPGQVIVSIGNHGPFVN